MNAMEMAMKMEQEAVDFYTTCAGKTNNPIGKKMFLSIVEDEKYHLACAAKVVQGQEFKPAETTPLQDMKTLSIRTRRRCCSGYPQQPMNSMPSKRA